MSVDLDIGSAAVRLWIAAGAAALLATACMLAFARAKATPLQSLERATFIVVAAALGAVMTWAFLGQSVAGGYEADRRALEQRAGDLADHALAPGSALACLDAAAGDEIVAACEKSLFASPAAVAAATSYVTARLVLLSEMVAYEKRGGSGMENTQAQLRRAVEADRYGFLAHALAVRDGCTNQDCKALAVLSDPSHIRDNLRASTFDDYLSRYMTAWNQPADTPLADASQQAGGAPPRRIVNIDFPSAASIPAVSIMNPEPASKPAPAASANQPDAQPGGSPKKGRKPAGNSQPPSQAQADPVWTPAPAAPQTAAAPSASAPEFASSPSGPMQLMPQTSPQ